MLELGSEVDVSLKYYCKLLSKGFNAKSIGKYCKCITDNNAEFIIQKVKIIHTDQELQPWINWQTAEHPFWWAAYNAVKHNRSEVEEIDGIKQYNYKFANLEYTLQALAGLFQVMVYTYYDIAISEGQEITTPLPGSRLFRLVGGIWDSVRFYGDIAFYVDKNTGNLKSMTNILLY